MAPRKSHDQPRLDDCRQTTRIIFEAVANAFHDRAGKWLSGDKKHDVDHPEIRLQRYFGAFCDINDDLKRYNFGGALELVGNIPKAPGGEVYSQMDLLEKALKEASFFWEPDLDPSTLDPLARRLSDAGLFLRHVAETVDAKQQTAGGKGIRPRKRRQAAKARGLTEKQAEAVHIVGECKGNIAEAARRLGRDAKTVRQHFKAAMKKLGTTVVKHTTKQLQSDRRGQANIADGQDRRR